MERFDRLERVTDLLLVLLDTPRPLSLREIADRVPGYPAPHGARRQAFERDKRLLRDEGVPILVETLDGSGENQLGYRVEPESYYLPDLGLDPGEQAALTLAVAGVHLGDPIGKDALSKLGAVADALAFDLAPAPFVDLPSSSELPALPVLFEAVRHGASVEFDYRGASRHVDVAGIRFRRGHWYAVGLDRDRNEERTFRVDRIESLPLVGPPSSARLPEGFDVEGSFARDPWQFGSGEETTVDIWCDAVEAGRVVGELGDHTIVERRADGSVVIRLTVTDDEALITWVLGLLDHAEVLAPDAMRSAVVARLTSIAVAARTAAP
jgi:proteasome accessory factor B